MSFSPLPTTRKPSRVSSPLRYATVSRASATREVLSVRIMIQRSVLDQVKGDPRFWRLDIDLEGRRARLTGMMQDDGLPATKGMPIHEKPDIGFNWLLPDSHLACFPLTEGKTTALPAHTITSLGVEFDLPPLPSAIKKKA